MESRASNKRQSSVKIRGNLSEKRENSLSDVQELKSRKEIQKRNIKDIMTLHSKDEYL